MVVEDLGGVVSLHLLQVAQPQYHSVQIDEHLALALGRARRLGPHPEELQPLEILARRAVEERCGDGRVLRQESQQHSLHEEVGLRLVLFVWPLAAVVPCQHHGAVGPDAHVLIPHVQIWRRGRQDAFAVLALHLGVRSALERESGSGELLWRELHSLEDFPRHRAESREAGQRPPHPRFETLGDTRCQNFLSLIFAEASHERAIDVTKLHPNFDACAHRGPRCLQ
mmetsp:Transcript_9878/g.24180  ORF Transcript_9878/g.24180 Transcript_9878/m.24180 type:complete len:226 (+) Transcript_9878:346-1023(+)